MSKITMLLLFYLFLFPQTLFSETAMKCEAGKCGSSKQNMSKEIDSAKVDDPKAQDKGSKQTIKQLFNVKTVQVKKISSAKKQINYGYIVAQDTLKIDVTARYSGYVDVLFADTLYKKVKKGDVLAKVYSAEVYRAKQDYLNSINYNETRSAPAMLQSAKMNLILLGVSLDEITRIHSQRKANEFTTIYAPLSGWIFEKNINQGSAFNSNKKLFQIINLDKVWAEIKLFQNELKNLDILKNFNVMQKSTNKVYEAKKSLLYPMLDPKEATATLRLIVDNEDGILKPGMYVKMYASSADKSRLIIPRTAAIRKNGIWYAFLSTEFKGEYEPVKIELQPLDNKNFEVLKGLSSSDTVVNNALFMMDSDAQINGIY